jgi:pyruvate dehydrogenase E2 component (dihydrolipoamide acetyltransferase)
MGVEFKLPDLGEGIHEAEVLAVKVKEGQAITEDEPLFEVETDKAVVEIPSPFTGVVEKILVAAGEIVKVGTVMIQVTEAGALSSTKEVVKKNGAKDSAKELAKDSPKEFVSEKAETTGKSESQKSSISFAPGEISEGQAQVANGSKTKAAMPTSLLANGDGPVPASPATRRLARELGVDLRLVPASGEAGRVLKEDVRTFAARALEPMVKDDLAFQQVEAPRAKAGEMKGQNLQSKYGDAEVNKAQFSLNFNAPQSDFHLPDFSKYGPVEKVSLRSIRRKTAESMARSWAHIPHVTHCDEADLTALEVLRVKHDPEVRKHGGKLTFTTLVLKAVVSALKKYPQFNASLDEEKSEIIFKHYYNIGIAVATERGLIVPVIKDVDKKSLIELAIELSDLAEKTRAGKVELDRLQGGTFTVTNIGAIGGTSMSPMINHPEAAILGMAKATQRPIVKDGKVEIGLIMPFALSFDHRIADGAEAAYFVRHIITRLEEPFTFLLEA